MKKKSLRKSTSCGGPDGHDPMLESTLYRRFRGRYGVSPWDEGFRPEEGGEVVESVAYILYRDIPGWHMRDIQDWQMDY